MVLPASTFLWLSIWAWLCFRDFWPDKLPTQYYSLIFLVSTLVVWLMPFQIFYPSTRKWLAVSLWRLLLSGFFPVEFRDFFIGDIVMSFTYSLSNAGMYFCLFSKNWAAGTTCDSAHSRLMGFLAALPPIWRFNQCLRRYADTGQWFPHLANAGKYASTIIYYALLSAWRINQNKTTEGLFISIAVIYTALNTFWDIFMDWSLFQVNSKYRFLRNELAYKNHYVYYIAMILDPIFRLLWILYAVFPANIQQSQTVSFFVAFTEIIRRFLWLAFRVENEHCANVGRSQAYKDVDLPYAIDIGPTGDGADRYPLINMQNNEAERAEGQSTGAATTGGKAITQEGNRPRKRSIWALSENGWHSPSSTAVAVSQALQRAHTQDFERRKQPDPDLVDDDEDDEEDEDTEMADVNPTVL
ncbi:hypothetical protein CANCADRAFT_30037 [Tortispora caseinolytica NRRL Y-17796]|uniref:EXS domain-containing protein n=1 Tax=Tortispora caseinolytica NRRL Y-17796 TaxID=767744 RepID=A0A1E4TIX6_9ASCO|nr:hypothetical protein CANCADRAFT_30037 [Tortispora caseinolytica NRRL Y-17796]